MRVHTRPVSLLRAAGSARHGPALTSHARGSWASRHSFRVTRWSFGRSTTAFTGWPSELVARYANDHARVDHPPLPARAEWERHARERRDALRCASPMPGEGWGRPRREAAATRGVSEKCGPRLDTRRTGLLYCPNI